ncbi:unnamed protein product [Pleuronectes platessa]|uniref:Uncharacterized protein n=1 Tax=Pleuronectes platessa TaxID=8262 RepID=A0A9N7TNC1_PLEPL|nr:unnamed protein product [Pleuronectes platessa]
MNAAVSYRRPVLRRGFDSKNPSLASLLPPERSLLATGHPGGAKGGQRDITPLSRSSDATLSSSASGALRSAVPRHHNQPQNNRSGFSHSALFIQSGLIEQLQL